MACNLRPSVAKVTLQPRKIGLPRTELVFISRQGAIWPAPFAVSRRFSRLDSDFVVHRGPELLLAAEISFRRLNGHMPEEELDLI